VTDDERLDRMERNHSHVSWLLGLSVFLLCGSIAVAILHDVFLKGCP